MLRLLLTVSDTCSYTPYPAIVDDEVGGVSGSVSGGGVVVGEKSERSQIARLCIWL